MTISSDNRRRIRIEIAIVLAITFGMSGLRSAFRLIDSLLAPEPLNQQSVTLNAQQSDFAWLDVALQVCSAATLFAYAALALFLLAGTGTRPPRFGRRDVAWGLGLAAVIGVPGLALYVGAVQAGWSKVVVPSAFSNPLIEFPSLLLFSLGNAFGEELVVVLWLLTRLRQLGWGWPAAIAASSVLRGSYHLYQGVSAGFGNIVMGVVFAYFYQRTGRVWPLVVAHFVIDAVAFVGYALLPDLSWLGLPG